jgi:hypothetical protein
VLVVVHSSSTWTPITSVDGNLSNLDGHNNLELDGQHLIASGNSAITLLLGTANATTEDDAGSFNGSGSTTHDWYVFALDDALPTTLDLAVNIGGKDPPSLTHTGLSDDVLWITALENDTGGLGTPSVPTNYTEHVSSDYICVGSRAYSAATEDPGVFTADTTGEQLTIAIRPRGPGPWVKAYGIHAWPANTTSPSKTIAGLTGQAVSDSDLLVVFMNKDDDVEPSAKPSGFTELASAESNNNIWGWVGVKKSDGTETSVAFTTDSEQYAMAIIIIDGSSWSGTIGDVEVWESVNTTSGFIVYSNTTVGAVHHDSDNPDPSWGTGDDNLALGFVGWDGNSVVDSWNSNGKWLDTQATASDTSAGAAGIAMAAMETDGSGFGTTTRYICNLDDAEQTLGAVVFIPQADTGNTGTAAVTAPAATVDATGGSWSGSAAVSTAPATLSASGSVIFVGTVASTAAPATLSATGAVANPVTGTAAVSVSPASLSATGALVFVGTAAVATPPATLSATGTSLFPVTGTATLTAPAATLSSTGLEIFVGSAAVSTAPASLSATGTALLDVTGTATLSVSPATLSADASVTVPPVTGTATLAAPAASLSSTGLESFVGTVAVSAPAASLSAAGLEIFSGVASVVAPAATLSAAGLEAFVGPSSVSAPAATLSASGWTTVTGTATLVAAPATLSATGDAGGVTGTAGLAAAPASLSATGTVVNPVTGTASVLVAAATLSAAGAVIFEGTLASSAAPATLSATGIVIQPISGTATVTAPAASLSASGWAEITGTATLSVAPATLSATGIAGATSGTSDAVAAPATLSASGTVVNPVTGVATLSVAPATLSGSGAEIFVGTITSTAAAATVAATGAEIFVGSATLTSPAASLTSTGASLVPVTGVATLEVEAATLSADGSTIGGVFPPIIQPSGTPRRVGPSGTPRRIGPSGTARPIGPRSEEI